jgi:hypothetical protein
VNYLKIIQTITKQFPAVIPHLKGRARFVAIYKPTEYKTVQFFTQELTRMIRNVYAGFTGGEFVDILFNLVAGQMKQAADQAWKDEGGDGATPSYLNELVMNAVLKQAVFVDTLYRDIVDARVDETPVEPILSRVPLWANRWTETYNQAVALIVAQRGGNLVWRLGRREEHCKTCNALNGIVAGALEWQALGVQPQNAPNGYLECGGWRCGCTLKPTKAKRTHRAFELINAAISG